MDDLRELDVRVAELQGWRAFKERRGEYTLCVAWKPGTRLPWERVHHYLQDKERQKYTEVSCTEAVQIGFFGDGFPEPSKDPAACAELDGEMRKRGYWGALLRLDGACLAVYFTPGQYGLKGLMSLLNEKGSRGDTECEARTRAAVRALENAAPRQQVTKDRDDTTH